MRTTIDLPDSLARRAKIRAVETHSSLKNLIVTALEKELAVAGNSEAKETAQSSLLPKLSVEGRRPYSLDAEEIDRVLREQEIE